MSLYLYRAHLPGATGRCCLHDTKTAVNKFRQEHPRIKECRLIDVGYEKHPSGVNVTLYFATNQTGKGKQ